MKTYSFPELENLAEYIERKKWYDASRVMSNVTNSILQECYNENKPSDALRPQAERKEIFLFFHTLFEIAQLVTQETLATIKAHDVKKPAESKTVDFNQLRDAQEALSSALRTAVNLSNAFHDFEEGQAALQFYFHALEQLSLNARLDYVTGKNYGLLYCTDHYAASSKPTHIQKDLLAFRDYVLQQVEPIQRLALVRRLMCGREVQPYMPQSAVLSDFYLMDVTAQNKDPESLLWEVIGDLASLSVGQNALYSSSIIRVPLAIFQAWYDGNENTLGFDLERLPRSLEQVTGYLLALRDKGRNPYPKIVADAADNFFKTKPAYLEKIDNARRNVANDRAVRLLERVREVSAASGNILPFIPDASRPVIASTPFSIESISTGPLLPFKDRNPSQLVLASLVPVGSKGSNAASY